MCGILGIVTTNPEKERIARTMAQSIAYRGPDAQGFENFSHCVLGHCRLSIVDLSTGAQPMSSKDTCLTFNGEIYGYKEIKKGLDYPFRTTSDTEVILALYEKYGTDLTPHLPGMFAFAIWDEKKQTLFAARDRFGEKPFYYAHGKNGEFIFSSEIKAILASGLIEPEIDPDSVSHYLRKLYVHPYKTIYKNIHTLPPAHSLTYTDGKTEIKKYWHLPEIRNDISLEDALPEFKRLLTHAVEKQLVADVPVGAFLSGGLDSTTIVGLASQFTKKIKTFSFGFEGTKNELGFAKIASDAFQTEHYELHDHHYNIADLIMKMTTVYDEPFADSSNISTYLVSKLASEHVKVALTGDGGDELLGGYGWYKSLIGIKDKKLFDSHAKSLLFKVLAKGAMRLNLKNKVDIISESRRLHYSLNYPDTISAHRSSNVYFKENILAHTPDFKLLDTVDDALRDDIEDYMPGDILVKIDRASMAHSLELRSPFLDVPFAEFAASLPFSLKVNKDEDKILLRRAFTDIWPEEIRKRGKLGFGAPVSLWLKKPEVQALVREYLGDRNKKIYLYVSPDIKHSDYKTWILLTLSLWLETR